MKVRKIWRKREYIAQQRWDNKEPEFLKAQRELNSKALRLGPSSEHVKTWSNLEEVAWMSDDQIDSFIRSLDDASFQKLCGLVQIGADYGTQKMKDIRDNHLEPEKQRRKSLPNS